VRFKSLIIVLLFLILGVATLNYRRVLGVRTDQDTWSFVAAGDVMLGRSVNTQSLRRQDFTWAFKNVAPTLSQADLTLVNLESPLIADCPSTDQGMLFCGLPGHLQGLKLAGVDIANLANNHIYNHGQKGFRETVDLLSQNQISPLGNGYRVSKQVGQLKISFLGYQTLSQFDPEKALLEIQEVKKNSDLLIVSFHWGSEYQSKPQRSQVELAHRVIDAGADVIIGHHPHWVQTEETYQGKPIFYSLGNLIFDQMWSDETRRGLIVKLNFSGAKLLSIDRIPITIYDYGQPKLN